MEIHPVDYHRNFTYGCVVFPFFSHKTFLTTLTFLELQITQFPHTTVYSASPHKIKPLRDSKAPYRYLADSARQTTS